MIRMDRPTAQPAFFRPPRRDGRTVGGNRSPGNVSVFAAAYAARTAICLA